MFNAYRISMTITTVSGMLSMYEEHMKRKAAKLHRLKLCLRRLESKDKTLPNTTSQNLVANECKKSLKRSAENITPTNDKSDARQDQINIGKLIASIEQGQSQDKAASQSMEQKHSDQVKPNLSDTCKEQTVTNQELTTSLHSPKRRRLEAISDV